ncbi:MAG TPA: hypothetical protein PKA77_14120 [Chitinophagaceae bacterium]|jgi:uncharacterized membrane protein YfcA|nr:hypothetical protein [Chitinophagaceae bacterium]HMU58626.1 hypothetical protein [Chitinophagaceae bacterium]
MKDKPIVATTTLVLSLLSYWYAREANKDAVPYVMLGGFIGSLLGETIAEKIDKSKTDNKE